MLHLYANHSRTYADGKAIFFSVVVLSAKLAKKTTEKEIVSVQGVAPAGVAGAVRPRQTTPVNGYKKSSALPKAKKCCLRKSYPTIFNGHV